MGERKEKQIPADHAQIFADPSGRMDFQGGINMNRAAIIRIIVAAVVVAAALRWCRAFLEVDKCLDAGGGWNYESSTCEGAKWNSMKLRTGAKIYSLPLNEPP
jgi:hypothetical protein